MLNKPYRDKFTFDCIPVGLPSNLFQPSRQPVDSNIFTLKQDIERYILVIHDLNTALKLESFSNYLEDNEIDKNLIKVVPSSSNKNVDKFEELIYIAGRVPRLNFSFTYSDNQTWVFGSYFIAPKSRIPANYSQSMTYLLGVLNSKLMKFYLDVMGKKKDADTELGSSAILDIPIKLDLNSLTDKEKDLIEQIQQITEEIIEIERNGEEISSKQEELDFLIFELYNINGEEQKNITEYIETVRNLL